MVGRPQAVRYRTIIRAFKAAEAAGVRNPRVEIREADGSTITISGDGRGVLAASANVTAPKTGSDADLDRELEDWRGRHGR